MSSLQKLILATLAYYDLFDFPLTADEIRRYLVAPQFLNLPISHVGRLELETVPKELYSLTNANRVILYEGFYTFPFREHLVPVRIRRTRIAQKKMRLTRRAVWLMSCMPYVRAVFASGSLALGTTDHDSDLDLFIITKAGRIWTARFIINSVFDILRLKRKPQDKIAPNKICPNHLIADNALAIINRNVFTARVYSHLIPLYVRKNALLKNFRQENEWLYSYINSWDFSKSYLIKNISIVKGVKYIQELVLKTKIGDLMEKLCRKYQKYRIEKNPLTRHPQGRIEYNDYRLEFHPHSIENTIIANYHKHLESVLRNL